MTPQDEIGGSQTVRSVILHYHTYKNAGSTVDKFLQSVFPEAWKGFDFEDVPEFFIHHSELVNIVRNRPWLKAASSHQVRLPVPVAPRLELLPIVFIRHPILRAASIWRFERNRMDDHPRTILAREKGMGQWISDTLYGVHERSICDAQSLLFSYALNQRTWRKDPTIPERAMANVMALPFIGVVEHFDRSMAIFEQLYSPKVPEFRYRPVSSANVTGDIGKSVSEQLEAIQDGIGAKIFNELTARNESDFSLYKAAEDRLRSFTVESEQTHATK